jgi:hypothetical protein
MIRVPNDVNYLLGVCKRQPVQWYWLARSWAIVSDTNFCMMRNEIFKSTKHWFELMTLVSMYLVHYGFVLIIKNFYKLKIGPGEKSLIIKVPIRRSLSCYCNFGAISFHVQYGSTFKAGCVCWTKYWSFSGRTDHSRCFTRMQFSVAPAVKCLFWPIRFQEETAA